MAELLKQNEIRVLVDDGDDTIGKKIRTHRKMQPAYMVILGEGEAENRTVSLRARNGDQISDIPLDQFIADMIKEISDKDSQPGLVPSQQQSED